MIKPFALVAVYAIAALDQLPSGAGGSAPAAAKAPEITLEHQLEYFRTDGRLAHLRAEVAEANAEYDAAVAAVRKDCGADAIPLPAQDNRRLVCVATKPPEAKK